MRTHPAVGRLCSYRCLLPHLKTHPRKPEKTQRFGGGERGEQNVQRVGEEEGQEGRKQEVGGVEVH